MTTGNRMITLKKSLQFAILITGFALIAQAGWSQNTSTAETALLFSRSTSGGSARVRAMGGAQVALGGDFSSATSNPAGLGMFNRSEFTISPWINGATNDATYLDKSTSATRSRIAIPAFSIVFHADKDKGNLISGNFAISFNRLNDYNRTYSYEATNPTTSIIDYFIQDAYGTDYRDLLSGGSYAESPTGLAFSSYLIDTLATNSPAYISALGTNFNDPAATRSQLQHEDIKFSGAQNQWSFSYGVNLGDKIYLGGGLGVRMVEFQSHKTYTESNFQFALDPNYKPVTRFSLDEQLHTSSSFGINGTLGLIYRPIDVIQVGLSYTTPTSLQMTDIYNASMNTDWNNFYYYGPNTTPLNNIVVQTQDVVSHYRLKTPSRMAVGATGFIQKYGLITGEVELVNYANSNYKSKDTGVSYDQDNRNIASSFVSAVNYRLGGELRLQSFRLRGGYSYMADPYKTTHDTDRSIQTVSGGAGYRTAGFYVDITVMSSSTRSLYNPYKTVNYLTLQDNSPVVNSRSSNLTFMVTLGFPF